MNPTKNFLVIGKQSKNIQNQMGGWTVTWQGKSWEGVEISNIDFPNTSSIYESLSKHIIKHGGNIEFSDEQPDESDLKFEGEDKEEKFFKFYRKKYPDSTRDVQEMAFAKFAQDGEIVDANSLLIPEDFEKSDKPDLKKTFINRTGVPDLRSLENDISDEDENKDDDENLEGGDGKFTLKKII